MQCLQGSPHNVLCICLVYNVNRTGDRTPPLSKTIHHTKTITNHIPNFHLALLDPSKSIAYTQ